LAGLLGEKNGNCLNPNCVILWGFAISLVANCWQIFVGGVMLRASGVAIRDREDVLEGRPHKEWTQWEYLVLNQLLVHGAEHHKPLGRLPGDLNRSEKCVKCLKEGNWVYRLNPCYCLCEGVEDVTSPLGETTKAEQKRQKTAKGGGKWNVPSSQVPSSQSSSRWQTPPQFQQQRPMMASFGQGGAQQQQRPLMASYGQGGMQVQQQPQQVQSRQMMPSFGMPMAMPQQSPRSGQLTPSMGGPVPGGGYQGMETANPVFAREARRASVDV